MHNLLQTVIKHALPRYVKEESLRVLESLANRLVPERPHKEKVDVSLPLISIVALKHACLYMRGQKPVVLTGIELVRMSERQILSHSIDSPVSPLAHESSQVEVVVDSIVMELFLLDLVRAILEVKVEPLNEIKDADAGCEQIVVDLRALDYIHCE